MEIFVIYLTGLLVGAGICAEQTAIVKATASVP